MAPVQRGRRGGKGKASPPAYCCLVELQEKELGQLVPKAPSALNAPSIPFTPATTAELN